MKRSWRVEILPFLEYADLYGQYKKDEPWDSENNKKVLAQMPPIFRHPSQAAKSTNTAVVAAYGPDLIFGENDPDGTRGHEITDGRAHTIMVLEAKTEIPWTKPEEIRIDLTQDKFPTFGFFPEGFFVAFADGSVHFISNSIDRVKLKPFFTKAGGEPANF